MKWSLRRGGKGKETLPCEGFSPVAFATGRGMYAGEGAGRRLLEYCTAGGVPLPGRDGKSPIAKERSIVGPWYRKKGPT